MMKRRKFKKTNPGEPIPVTVRERCKELVDVTDKMTCHLYNVIDWMFEHPDYNSKTKVIPKKDYPILVDVTF